IFEKSLAAWQQNNIDHHGKSAADMLWKDFSLHLKFLHEEGFVDEAGKLTDDGRWAACLRLDYPLLVAECLRENAFPVDNERLLAAIVAVFAYDRDDEIHLATAELPHKLMAALRKMLVAVRPMSRKLQAAGFQSPKLYPS